MILTYPNIMKKLSDVPFDKIYVGMPIINGKLNGIVSGKYIFSHCLIYYITIKYIDPTDSNKINVFYPHKYSNNIYLDSTRM